MRTLTYTESGFVAAGAFIEGWVTDDFAVAGATVGFVVGVLGLGLYANHCYNKKLITLKEATTCVLFTALQAAAYGVIVDTLWGITNVTLNTINS